jgi:hypothetical protein
MNHNILLDQVSDPLIINQSKIKVLCKCFVISARKPQKARVVP